MMTMRRKPRTGPPRDRALTAVTALDGPPGATMNKLLAILGTRGIPARHGGFETFAEHLALYLVDRGWRVTVYCQEDQSAVPEKTWREGMWKGVRLVHIPVRQSGPLGTLVFDLKAMIMASREPGLVLTLGYNSAVFCLLLRLVGRPNVINMDGLEWQRSKWSWPARAWFYINEWLGCWLADHLLADHPAIYAHLSTRVASRTITMIPYGADPVEQAEPSLIEPLGLSPQRYILLVARPEPENSILEVVSAFSARTRGVTLAIVGDYYPDIVDYHRQVRGAAGPEVQFLGAIYDRPVVQSLRYHALLYVHGHRVGGTNPSLLEALGAGSAVLAHDNRFNRWVAGEGARYFTDAATCITEIDRMLSDPEEIHALRRASRERFEAQFRWDHILPKYEEFLTRWLPVAGSSRRRAVRANALPQSAHHSCATPGGRTGAASQTTGSD
jgi:glycosyltransferase involved in cell wall biosynthesis